MQENTPKPVAGIRLAAVEAQIKKADRNDLVVVELAEGTHSAAVFTQNRFRAAPVQVAGQHLAASAPRYLMINTGYANAGTGQKGLEDCHVTCDLLAHNAGCAADEILPFSTGVISERFDVTRFRDALPSAVAALNEANWQAAAEGIMTTDTYAKVVSRQVDLDGTLVTVTGMAKGSGMIKPNMATMLGFIATDAAIAPDLLASWVKSLADVSFNCAIVDGDTSTNDACVLMATGKAGNAPISTAESTGAKALYAVLESIFVTLAQALVRDGEGATKFVTLEVNGADTQADARKVAETIAQSPLVKTALFASDPNWGRILAAIGRAPVDVLDVEKVAIYLDEVLICENGACADSYRETDGSAVVSQPEFTIRVELNQGQASQTLWTCDFSYDYVKINAEYRS